MDPVSILMLTNASFAIARSLVHTIKELYELAEQYETAALGIKTVATQCDSFRIAIQRINRWLQKQNEDSKHDLDEDFWQALQGNLDTGKLVLEDLEKRIQGLRKNPAKFWIRTKYLWNGVVIAELQSQIQGLMAAVSILLQVIDLPTISGKRSQSVAQKQRLNGLTVRNRNKAVEQHRRMQESQEQGLLDDTTPEQPALQDSSPPQSVIQPTLFRHEDAFSHDKRSAHVNFQQQVSTDSAPPPYEYYSNNTKTPPPTQSYHGRLADYKKPVPEVNAKTSSFEVLDKTKSKESKESSGEWTLKRPTWRALIKRSSKQEPARSQSDGIDATKNVDKISSSATPSVSIADVVSQVQRTPAAINTSPEQEDYFELQQAMSGMQVPSDVVELSTEKPNDGSNSNFASHRGQNTSPFEMDVPTVTTSPEQKFSSNNPYAQIRYEAQSNSDTNMTGRSRPRYQDNRSNSADNFYRIRPSQIVQEARERSESRGAVTRAPVATSPPPEPLSRQSTGGNRLGSMNFGAGSDLQQTWQTTTLNNRTMKFKTIFEKESFTNKISASAARALGVDDATQEFAGIPITHLTLLYTVSDGLSVESSTVLGDEAEFVVMDEHESRTPLLILGAAFAHFARIAEEGEYIYWSPRSVPENVRNAEKLRLYRRFELVRW